MVAGISKKYSKHACMSSYLDTDSGDIKWSSHESELSSEAAVVFIVSRSLHQASTKSRLEPQPSPAAARKLLGKTTSGKKCLASSSFHSALLFIFMPLPPIPWAARGIVCH